MSATPFQTLSPKVARRDEFGTFLNELNLVGIGVEVGVFRGDFARQLLSSWHGSKLILVDPWVHLGDYLDSWNFSDEIMELNYQHTRKTLKKFKDRLSFLRMRSEVAAAQIPDCSCDFIYLDGNHSYDSVRNDLNAWYPKLKPRGIMSGHDYFDAMVDRNFMPVFNDEKCERWTLTSYGVKSAVDEFLSQLSADLHVTNEEWPTWYFRKAE